MRCVCARSGASDSLRISHPSYPFHAAADADSLLQYDSQVTLFIENADGSTTPSGWSTRKEGGGNDRPLSFTPGQGLIAGWTEGVLKMREGERAKIHVPSEKGYGGSPQGQKGGVRFATRAALRTKSGAPKTRTQPDSTQPDSATRKHFAGLVHPRQFQLAV